MVCEKIRFINFVHQPVQIFTKKKMTARSFDSAKKETLKALNFIYANNYTLSSA